MGDGEGKGTCSRIESIREGRSSERIKAQRVPHDSATKTLLLVVVMVVMVVMVVVVVSKERGEERGEKERTFFLHICLLFVPNIVVITPSEGKGEGGKGKGSGK